MIRKPVTTILIKKTTHTFNQNKNNKKNMFLNEPLRFVLVWALVLVSEV